MRLFGRQWLIDSCLARLFFLTLTQNGLKKIRWKLLTYHLVWTRENGSTKMNMLKSFFTMNPQRCDGWGWLLALSLILSIMATPSLLITPLITQCLPIPSSFFPTPHHKCRTHLLPWPFPPRYLFRCKMDGSLWSAISNNGRKRRRW